MASKKDKGSWSGDPKAYHGAGPVTEAARWLRSTVRSFLEERDGPQVVDEAVEEWIRVRWPHLRYVLDTRTDEELAADGVPPEQWPKR